MGERVMIIFKGRYESPWIYLHRSSPKQVGDYLQEAADLLRLHDPAYSCARFIALLCEKMPGNLDVGVYNNCPGSPRYDDHGYVEVNIDTGEYKTHDSPYEPGDLLYAEFGPVSGRLDLGINIGHPYIR